MMLEADTLVTKALPPDLGATWDRLPETHGIAYFQFAPDQRLVFSRI
ncbi:MAG: hypothetical protein H7A53_06145 [Akkermansiaceae bacterium]|nr:hypothetical protein [Akkermansiaceae bacterium]